MSLKVSIIILTWNTAAITKKCVDTINQYLKNQLEYEIIVVDNHSTDNTASLLAKSPHLIYHQNADNLGFSKGNNIGAKIANSPYLLFLNSDMEFIDNHLVDLIHFMDKHPHVGAAGPQFLNPDMTPQASAFPPQTPFNAFKEFWLNQPTYSKYLPNTKTPTLVYSLSGGALLISRALFQQIGGWDERYYFYFEDLEICRQIHAQGLEIYYYPQMKVIHRHGASVAQINNSRDIHLRLVSGAKIYHGILEYYLITWIIWLSHKLKNK